MTSQPLTFANPADQDGTTEYLVMWGQGNGNRWARASQPLLSLESAQMTMEHRVTENDKMIQRITNRLARRRYASPAERATDERCLELAQQNIYRIFTRTVAPLVPLNA